MSNIPNAPEGEYENYRGETFVASEYRCPKEGEWYFHNGEVIEAFADRETCHWIMRPTIPVKPTAEQLASIHILAQKTFPGIVRFEFVDYRVVRKGDWYFNNFSKRCTLASCGPYSWKAWICKPVCVEKPTAEQLCRITGGTRLDLPNVIRFEIVAFRPPIKGDWYYNKISDACVQACCSGLYNPEWVCKPILQEPIPPRPVAPPGFKIIAGPMSWADAIEKHGNLRALVWARIDAKWRNHYLWKLWPREEDNEAETYVLAKLPELSEIPEPVVPKGYRIVGPVITWREAVEKHNGANAMLFDEVWVKGLVASELWPERDGYFSNDAPTIVLERIPEPVYRPFKPDEVRLGWEVVRKSNGTRSTITTATPTGTVIVPMFGMMTVDRLLEHFTFTDGTPCGVEEVE